MIFTPLLHVFSSQWDVSPKHLHQQLGASDFKSDDGWKEINTTPFPYLAQRRPIRQVCWVLHQPKTTKLPYTQQLPLCY